MFPTAITFHIHNFLSAVRIYHSNVVSTKYLKLYEGRCELRSFPDRQNVVFSECPRFRRQKSKDREKIISREKRNSQRNTQIIY